MTDAARSPLREALWFTEGYQLTAGQLCGVLFTCAVDEDTGHQLISRHFPQLRALLAGLAPGHPTDGLEVVYYLRSKGADFAQIYCEFRQPVPNCYVVLTVQLKDGFIDRVHCLTGDRKFSEEPSA